MNTKRLVTDAMLVAMYFLLGNYFGLNLGGIRITLDILPIIVGAALYGPVDGMLIGLVGNFLFQLAGPYGISVTTPLWMLPDGVRGLLTGLLLHGRWQNMSKTRLATELLLMSIVATTVTTGVMYVDCFIYQYSFAAYAPFVLWRYGVAVILALLIALLLPMLLKSMGHALNYNRGKQS